MAGFTAADFTPASPASMAAGFIPGFMNFMPAGFIPGFMNFMPAGFIPGFTNFMPAASTTAILANSTDLITKASAVGLLSSPPSAPGGAVDGAGPITITQSGGAADGARPITFTQTAATTDPDLTPAIGIIAPIRGATTPT